MSELLITDLPHRIFDDFQPARCLVEVWIPVTWETAEHSGAGLAAGASSGAQELIPDLNLEGRTSHILL